MAGWAAISPPSGGFFSEGGPDRAIIGVDEIEGLFMAGQLSEAAEDARVIRISSGQKLVGPGWNIFLPRKGFLAEYRAGRQVASIDLRAMPGLPGAHNHQNACAAYAVARSLGAAPRLIADAMASFMGLPHRKPVGRRSGWCALHQRFQGHLQCRQCRQGAASLRPHPLDCGAGWARMVGSRRLPRIWTA